MNVTKKLQILFGDRFFENEPLYKYTTWRSGGPARFFILVNDVRELGEVALLAKEKKLPVFILGNGSNVLFADNGFDGIVLKLVKDFETVKLESENILAGAGVRLGKLSDYAKKHCLSGLEFARDIPGTVGGTVITNAGAYGDSIGRLVEYVELFDFDSTQICRITPEFKYRNSMLTESQVVISACLKLTKGRPDQIIEKMNNLKGLRKEKQPTGKSAGSVFKNPPGAYAAKLIEDAGCKGLRCGDAIVSKKHANFIINQGDAKSSDIYRLIMNVRERVFKYGGVYLETEVKLVGFGGQTG
jgi:UDP-N-acetylmuramate dehydrogenase